MSFVSPSAALLATCGGDTVKLFDLTVDSGDPCTLSHTPSHGSQINCVRWNHTNLVVASAGDDNKISLLHKNGQNMGRLPLSGSDLGDDIEESISSINFSNKGSRYVCSGGSGHMVRIWDLQRKRCIKWLSGHTDTITGVMYNCKDEHLASISTKGDIIVYNLASGARAAELKDPNGQALRVLDYSRLGRHILVVAGDDGSVHMWDTTGRNPKVSWLKQHSAPTTGLCFSPASDKMIASVGLDKKLYTYDSASKRLISCIPYEAPLSSLAYADDGNILAAGTNCGRVVFYDVRARPQPFTELRAYASSEVVTSISWQRSKPVIVNENSCTDEMAVLGGSCEDSVLMPDPMPSMSTSATTGLGARSPMAVTTSGPVTAASQLSAVHETPSQNRLWAGGSLSKLQAPRSNYTFKDDMEVFSPLVDVQPITPSLGNWWDDLDEAKKDGAALDKNSSLFPSSIRRFPFTEGLTEPHPIQDWRSGSISKQGDAPSAQLTATPAPSSKNDLSLSPTPPEAWGGNALADKLIHQRSRFMPSVQLATGLLFPGSQDSSLSSSHSIKNSLASSSLNTVNLQTKNTSSNDNAVSSDIPASFSSNSISTCYGTRLAALTSNPELPGAIPSLPRKYSSYAERISTSSSFSEGIGSAVGSPKSKKTGAETREELINSILSRQGASVTTVTGSLPATNGSVSQLLPTAGQSIDQHGASFSLQLVQRTLEETLGSVQKSIHEDVRNLHIELLRQFHLQEMETSSMMTAVVEKQEELLKEVQALRKENQQLRNLL